MGTARLLTVSGLLSFNGGFIDVACFFGLKGLLAAHITGNLAVLGASLVLGHTGLLGKIAAVPEFMVVAALTHAAGRALQVRGWPAARILLGLVTILLALFLTLALRFGPFTDADSTMALTTSLAAIAAMAVQNGAQRTFLRQLAPTTFMTGNATQASVDLADLLSGATDAAQKRRLAHVGLNLACFAAGCAVAAAAFLMIGFAAVAITLPAAALAMALAP